MNYSKCELNIPLRVGENEVRYEKVSGYRFVTKCKEDREIDLVVHKKTYIKGEDSNLWAVSTLRGGILICGGYSTRKEATTWALQIAPRIEYKDILETEKRINKMRVIR